MLDMDIDSMAQIAMNETPDLSIRLETHKQLASFAFNRNVLETKAEGEFSLLDMSLEIDPHDDSQAHVMILRQRPKCSEVDEPAGYYLNESEL